MQDRFEELLEAEDRDREAEQAGEGRFTQLSGALSQLLKDKFLNRDKDLREKKLERF